MLTPEDIKEFEENNKIVKLYRQLNIDICSDIIQRLTYQKGKIDKDDLDYIENQLRVLKETDGDAFYKKILLETSKLDTNIKYELKSMYETMAKKQMQGYEKLYEYRELPMKLSSTQIKILNGATKKSAKTFSNFTNTIAFAGKQLYVDAVDQAYINTITGGLSYEDAITKAVKQVAEKGITLQDAAGRNVKLETAVKRNILTGIKQTADKINQDIDEELGCDGYETTAHVGARPEHAEWQGKQFAKTKTLAKKYGVEAWDESQAKEELNDYGCRHTYFGIILGISEPVYSRSDLKYINNYTVKVNKKDIPLYEANQQMQYIKQNVEKYATREETYKQVIDKYGENTGLKELLDETRLLRQNWEEQYRTYSNQSKIPTEKVIINKLKVKNDVDYDIISKQVRKVIKKPTANVKIKEQIYIPQDIHSYSFDDDHMNSERNHNATKEEAIRLIYESKLQATVWKGTFFRYYGENGAVYVNVNKKLIRTVYKEDEFFGDALKIKEIIENEL